MLWTCFYRAEKNADSGQNVFVPFNDDSLKIKLITNSFGNQNKYLFIHDQSNYLINIIFHKNWETSSNLTHQKKPYVNRAG